MNVLPPTGFVPRFLHSIYWQNKERFELYEDISSNWIIFVIESGSFYYEIGDKKGNATFGDVVICPPHIVFRRVVVSPLTFHWFALQWENGSDGAGDPSTHIPAGKISIRDTERLAANNRALRSADALLNPWRMTVKNHYLQDIWLTYCEETRDGLSESDGMYRGAEDPVMKRASYLIRQNAFYKFELKALAKSLGISPVQLSKKFKTAYGITPIQYLTSLRLERAKTLLMETRLTLEQISECCGYQSGFYLNRVFLKHERITPSQFRKASRI